LGGIAFFSEFRLEMSLLPSIFFESGKKRGFKILNPYGGMKNFYREIILSNTKLCIHERHENINKYNNRDKRG